MLMVEFHMIAIGELIKYPKHTIPGKQAPNRRPVLRQLQTFQARKGGREPGSVEHEVARTFQCAVPGFSFALTMASASLPYSSSK